MKTITVRDGTFNVPKRLQIHSGKRRINIKTPWMCTTRRLVKNNWTVSTKLKDNWTVSTNIHYRHKKLGEKPYVPEDEIHIDGEVFKVKVVASKVQNTEE